jgi:tetratricopeptide (TPR) repeat protein
MIGTMQQSTSELVTQGLRFHQNGDLLHAEQMYRAILAREPRHGDALHLLGSLRGRQGRNEDGIRLIEEAIAVNPRMSAYYNNLGNLQVKVGDRAGAEASYRRAIRVDRKNADAHLNLGKLLEGGTDADGMEAGGRQSRAKARESYVASLRLAPRSVEAHMSLGRLEEAEERPRAALESYRNAVRLEPGYAGGHLAIGNVQAKLEAREEAEASYRAALALDAGYADAYFNLANLLCAQERVEEAVELYRKAIDAAPLPDAEMYNKLGVALSVLERAAEAEAAFRKAIELRPEFYDAHFNLGKLLSASGDMEGGAAALRRAIELNPEDPDTCLFLAAAVYEMGQLPEAIAANSKALSLREGCMVARRNLGMALSQAGDLSGLAMLEGVVREMPENPNLHWNWGEQSLLHGRYEEGWREYEWRMQVDDLKPQYREADVPRWRGEAIAGKRILIYAEQGFGDTLQFARYARLVAARGATVILEVHQALQRWCAALPGVTECVAKGSAVPEFDLTVPMMSLPYILETRAETIPPPVAARVEGRRRDGSGLQVGMVWAGNGKHVRDRLRSTRLAEWSGLAGIEGVEFTSLQAGDPAAQIAQEGHGFRFVADCAGSRDFADTAEMIAGLDLVITVDTAVAHLAGSMGKPVWILLYNLVDWRWGLEGNETPWYPTARLFRQRTPADWSEVFAEVEAGVRELARR